MQFSHSHLRDSKPAPRRQKNEPVFGIGWHAFVNWPQPVGKAPAPVPMIDGAGKAIANDLQDGQEVEIVSWRPKAREGLVYQVRRTTDRTEWWIAASYLRRLRVAAPAVDVESPK
ncbi:MAG: hypothetical protein HY270_04705 [Deltaproteobacteria bacterium]|nr:hypothetical protein [Deltaproteobacteria bacterium]